jgi:putative mRNA 3-end processing factor
MPTLPDQVERAAHGLRVRGHSFYLEPRGRPGMGFLAHARGAPSVLPERTVATAATIALLNAAQPRALRRTAALPAAWGSLFALGSLRLSVHPAGHVLGSAQLRCLGLGVDLVYAGDLGGSGKRQSLTAEPPEQLRCETLVLPALYGSPRFVFPGREEALEQARDFVEGALRKGQTPVLVAAALGAAQDLVKALGEQGRTLRLHQTALRACEVYRAQGVALKNFVPLDEEGDVVVVPPTYRLDRLKLKSPAACTLSGRALETGDGIALSDHAGFDELVTYARESEASQVVCVHGHSDELAQALRARGVHAVALREHHQLSLPGL